MLIKKIEYIEDLTDFNGNIHELKEVVDHIHESYGWHANIQVSKKNKQINFIITTETFH